MNLKKLLTLILGVLLISTLTYCGKSGESYLGEWKIEKQMANAPLGNMEPSDLPKIIGSTLSFSKTSASCFGETMRTLGTTVNNPIYTSMIIAKEDFERLTGNSFQQLNMSGSKITQITVEKDGSFNEGIAFFVINQDTLLANSLGTFFLLTRKK